MLLSNHGAAKARKFMNSHRSATVSLEDIEREVTKKLRDEQSSQSFDGTLRVHLDKVLVSDDEGLRALKRLRVLVNDRLRKAD